MENNLFEGSGVLKCFEHRKLNEDNITRNIPAQHMCHEVFQ
jgi:hypothetical protein